MKPKLLFFKALVALFSALSFSSIAATLPNKLLGEAVAPSAATRTIVVKPNTKYVRVESGEIVKFVVGSRVFAWHFEGPEGPFDLRQIAPAGTLDRKIPGYINANPTNQGG